MRDRRGPPYRDPRRRYARTSVRQREPPQSCKNSSNRVLSRRPNEDVSLARFVTPPPSIYPGGEVAREGSRTCCVNAPPPYYERCVIIQIIRRAAALFRPALCSSARPSSGKAGEGERRRKRDLRTATEKRLSDTSSFERAGAKGRKSERPLVRVRARRRARGGGGGGGRHMCAEVTSFVVVPAPTSDELLLRSASEPKEHRRRFAASGIEITRFEAGRTERASERERERERERDAARAASRVLIR
jgi:hypothetical protein